MGGLLKMRSIAFAEDLLKDTEADSLDEFMKIAEHKYDNASVSCWIAACIYVATLAISLWQAFINKKHDKF
jgi:hypothetical protein